MLAGARIWLALGALAFFGLCILVPYLLWYYRNPTSTATPSGQAPPPPTPPTGTPSVTQDNNRPAIIAWIGGIIPIVSILLGFWQLIYTWDLTWDLPLIGELRVPWLIIGFNLLYIGFSFREVKENEYGVISFFGYMLNTVDNGLRFVPRILCRLIRLPAGQKTVEIGGGTAEEAAQDAARKDIISCPKPLAVTFAEGRDVTRELLAKIGTAGLPYWDGLTSGDPLNSRLRAGLKLTIVVRIAKGAAQQFVKRIQTFDNAVQQLEVNARGIADDVCTKITWAYFNHHQEEIADCILGELETFVGDPERQSRHTPSNKKVESWGLNIIKAAVQPSATSETVQAKIDDVIAAKEEKIAVEIRATAARKKLEEEGDGTAYAQEKLLAATATGRRKLLEAEAIGLQKLIEEYDKKPEIAGQILTIKAREAVAATAAHTIISDDILGPAAVKIKTALDAASKGKQT